MARRALQFKIKKKYTFQTDHTMPVLIMHSSWTQLSGCILRTIVEFNDTLLRNYLQRYTSNLIWSIWKNIAVFLSWKVINSHNWFRKKKTANFRVTWNYQFYQNISNFIKIYQVIKIYHILLKYIKFYQYVSKFS